MVETSDFNDTLGAGSYPEPSKTKMKKYDITFDCVCKATITLEAESYEKAEEELKTSDLLQSDYDIVFKDLEVEDIKDYDLEEFD